MHDRKLVEKEKECEQNRKMSSTAGTSCQLAKGLVDSTPDAVSSFEKNACTALIYTVAWVSECLA